MSVHPSIKHVCWVNERYISLSEFIVFFIHILTKTYYLEKQTRNLCHYRHLPFLHSLFLLISWSTMCIVLDCVQDKSFVYEETLSPSQIFSIYFTTPHSLNLITMMHVGHISFWHQYWGVTFNVLALISPTIENTNALQHLFIPQLHIK